MFTKKLFSLITCFLCLSFTLINPRAEAATLHAIVVGDTMEGGMVDLSTEFNLDMIQREMKRIAIYTEMELDMAVFEGYYVTQKNILDYFEQLNVAPDDVIVLTCIAHGSRDVKKSSKWPDMRFTLDWAFQQPRADFGYFIEILQSKKPRLLLALDESCNEFRNDESDLLNLMDEDDEEEKPTLEQIQDLYEKTVRKGPSCHYTLDNKVDHIRDMAEGEYITQYRKLFLEASGSVLTSSSSPGQTAYRQYQSTGGIYTCEFFKALHAAVWAAFFTHKDANWQTILETATINTQQHPAQGGYVQTPQYELLLK